MFRNTGVWFNGRIGVSKTFDVGSIPTTPANSKYYPKDIMPTNGCTEPFVGIISFKRQKTLSIDIFKMLKKFFKEFYYACLENLSLK